MVVLRSGSNTFDQNPDYEEKNGKPSLSQKTKMHSISSKQVQWITFISLVIDLLGFTVILPLFPAILQYYSKHDSSGLYSLLQNSIRSFQDLLNVPEEFNSVLFGGVLGSLFSFLQFLSSPIFGALSDVYGRKPIIIFSLIGISVSYGLWFIASNFVIFVLARIIGGLCKGNVSLSYSVMTDILDPQSRSKGMALIGVAFSIGFIIGPVVGVGFSKWGTSGWFAASAFYAFSLSLVNILFCSYYFQETLPKNKRLETLKTGFEEVSGFINPLRLFGFNAVHSLGSTERQKLRYLGKIYFFFLFVYSGLEFTVTFVTHYNHDFDSMAQGKMFMYLGIIMAVVQGGFVRRIKDGQEQKMCLISFGIMIPSFCIIGVSSSKTVLYIGLTLYAVGSSLMVPCLTALASQLGPVSQKGTILGIWRSLGALARASGPVVACFGFWSLGSGWSYSIGGCLLIIPLIMTRKL
ncbi:UNVERIFIED_CONTAM: hypothetical protein RMT77_016895 [Armadillidium vulgare]